MHDVPVTHRLARAVAATGLLLLASCASDGAEPGAIHTAALTGDVYSDLDASFATDMIQHHAQALALVDTTRGRDLSPELGQLADGILAGHTAEIEQLTSWLQDWQVPRPATVRDHASEHGAHSDAGSHLPGMVSETALTELTALTDQEFQQRWLELMIEHHKAAIELVQDEQEAGRFAPAVELADRVETGQRAQLRTMEDLLRR